VTYVCRREIIRAGLALVGIGLVAGCGVASFTGRQRSPLSRIGFLDVLTGMPKIEPFREGMRALGYVDGQNIVIEYRDTDVNAERIRALAAELVGLPVEIIVVSNTVAALAASQLTSIIPIVVAGGDFVAAGLVTNIAHPGGNVTGVSSNSVEVVGKWVELLKETIPGLTHVAVLMDLSNPAALASVPMIQRAAQDLQLPLISYDLRNLDQLPAALAAVKSEGADGVVFVSGGVIAGGADPRIGEAVRVSGLPALAQRGAFAANGGLLAHGPDNDALTRRSATYVDRILKGAQAGDLPIELPTQFEIIVNLKSAKELGITIPGSVLARATEVIQ
jgi:putative tryptophan/tyrosine transport system substrate-binding protein